MGVSFFPWKQFYGRYLFIKKTSIFLLPAESVNAYAEKPLKRYQKMPRQMSR